MLGNLTKRIFQMASMSTKLQRNIKKQLVFGTECVPQHSCSLHLAGKKLEQKICDKTSLRQYQNKTQPKQSMDTSKLNIGLYIFALFLIVVRQTQASNICTQSRAAGLFANILCKYFIVLQCNYYLIYLFNANSSSAVKCKSKRTIVILRKDHTSGLSNVISYKNLKILDAYI